MRTLLLIAASTLALGACAPKVQVATTKLTCPETRGDLTRTKVGADGRTCEYRSSDGAEVVLQLVDVQGDARTTLQGLEASLLYTVAPEGAAPVAQPAQISDTAQARSIAAEVARVHAEANADAGGRSHDGAATKADDHSGDGEVTRVDLPGIHINTTGDESAKVRIGPIDIDATGEDATVRVYREVRMRGEALSRERRGVRASFVYAGEDMPSGYRYVGYQAGGPKAGPITVATVRSKIDTESADNISGDVEELVRLNGGV